MNVVIFDMDGVLADTHALLAEARKDLFAKHGVTPAMIKDIYHLNIREKIAHLNKTYGKQIDPEKAREETRPHFLRLAPTAQPKPGAVELVRALKGKRKLAVATAGGREYCETILKAIGLADAFDIVLTASDVQNPKPHPEIYQKIMAHFNAKPEECVAIDDSIACIKTARQLGMHAIGVLCEFVTSADFAGLTNRVVKDLSELRPDEL